MPDFKTRSIEKEIMDDLDCGGAIIDQTLHELEVINKWLGGNAVTTNGLRQLLYEKKASHTITIADLGCGSGEMLRIISKWAKKNNYTVNLIGIDANPNIVAYAKQHSLNYPNIHFLAMDIFSNEFKAMQFDVVIGTLFYHHFTNQELIQFFAHLKNQVRLGFIINDIHRHPVAYHSIKLLTQAFSKSPMVKNDGPVSVLRAFSKKELIDIFVNAGITRISIEWKWAFRWQVVWSA